MTADKAWITAYNAVKVHHNPHNLHVFMPFPSPLFCIISWPWPARPSGLGSGCGRCRGGGACAPAAEEEVPDRQLRSPDPGRRGADSRCGVRGGAGAPPWSSGAVAEFGRGGEAQSWSVAGVLSARGCPNGLGPSSDEGARLLAPAFAAFFTLESTVLERCLRLN